MLVDEPSSILKRLAIACLTGWLTVVSGVQGQSVWRLARLVIDVNHVMDMIVGLALAELLLVLFERLDLMVSQVGCLLWVLVLLVKLLLLMLLVVA